RFGDQLPRQRNPLDDRCPALLVPLRGASVGTDDDDLAECRLLVLLELGPVPIVTPRTQRRPKADPRGCICIIAEPGEIDDGRIVARGLQLPRGGSAELLGRIPGCRGCSSPHQQQPPDSPIILKKLLRTTRLVTFKA